MQTKPRKRKCKVCGESFSPWNSTQVVCSAPCAIAKGREMTMAQEKKQHKERKEAVKRRPDLLAEAQQAFNAFIRARDILAGHGCIDCGRRFEPQKPGGSVDAGHYLSRGSHPNLRFHEDNCFAQRKNCNRPGGTTQEAFRSGVIARIGLQRVEALEGYHPLAKWSRDELRAIREEYRGKLRELRAKKNPSDLSASG